MRMQISYEQMTNLVRAGVALWVHGLMGVIVVNSCATDTMHLNGIWYLESAKGGAGLAWNRKRFAPALHPIAQELMREGEGHDRFTWELWLSNPNITLTESYYEWMSSKLIEEEAQ